MEMERAYYVVSYRREYLGLLPDQPPGDQPPERVIVAITQGGFGQDVVDDVRQVKERFLEYVFAADGVDLPRTAETFDTYFVLETAGEVIDLDEEL
jgi:hypothetical protein